MIDIQAVTESIAFKTQFKVCVFSGLVGVEVISIDDDDTSMYIHSGWTSEEMASNGSTSLVTVLQEHFAFALGPETRAPGAFRVGSGGVVIKLPRKLSPAVMQTPLMGPQTVYLNVNESMAGAYRFVMMTLKEDDGVMQTIADYMPSKLADFKQIPGLVDITVFSTGPTAGTVMAGYSTREALEAASALIQPIFAGLRDCFAEPPTLFGTEVVWSATAQ